MLLDIQGLSVRYGRIAAVRDASVNVAEGEVVAVLGANGAGKSSLLKAAIGLVTPNSGHILFAGSDATRWSTAQRLANGLVLVPEGRRIVMSLTVEENLLMGAYARRDLEAVRKEIGVIYERFPNLGERRHMLASVLSGGELQMLAIGRGALARPRLMMLDEPSLGLSPRLVQELFRHLVEINRTGLALLLVEQNTRKALGIASRAYVMELGRVVMSGTPGELLADDRLEAAYLGTGAKA
ncbi:MAG: ABC transporter ATP-binding protein [Betaproteobacteria bacterium]|nr:ABC transporter ATP-binding protein [Betaproteobacteria bacterium]MBI2961840.1 ABC transporter ATP-binding protein [Betaproteobacteria bacterium]